MVYTRNPIGLSVVVLALMMGAASGQGLTDKGVKLGLNLANVGGEFLDDVDPIMKLGFALGGYATLDFDLPVVIQPE
ncbi:MAG: hypothetical protein IID14_03785, partial [Candidatus Marinimicrobia bacterium]|nr:hypothetical protein [Candidatus Neomarinimicrobiota bacterium]